MAIEWPADLVPSEMTWGIVYNNRAFTSTLSNAQQVVGYPGDYWQCQLSFSGLTRDRHRLLTAMLGRLRGMTGTVRVPAWDRLRTDDIGSPTVVSGPAFATSMQLQGMTASKRVFSQGDYLTVAGEMFEVVQDATSDSSGKATVYVNKPIRKTLAAGTAAEYRNPYSEMRRMDNTNSSSVQPMVASLSLQFREAF
ncbi:hypothetical protein [Pseudomonas oryzihabitans]|uniref:hypothetical protein n=1 Tax=Pseudomonas oryzihabitans TaxID=47885 RepID=UPI0011215792|nr:hypothetical protein [Pseudomonas psychrotolerans]QDD87507.1 hypothetical protein CCZ28_00065 [Pseudomonas psychrotolerans]QDD91941.1 hypothetical protein CCZ28_24185 [Pseudomonas psychrotolerans]